MKNHLLVICGLGMVACAHQTKAVDSGSFIGNFKTISGPAEVKLELKSEAGRLVKVKHYSMARIQNQESEQVTRDKEESVDFAVEMNHAAKKGENLHYIVKTTAKDGVAALADMGFPELNQQISFEITPQGIVKKAGDHKPGSIYFISPLPLPGLPLEVGDTWEIKEMWYGEGGLPFQLEGVGILKNFISCRSGLCAHLEISAEVMAPQALSPIAKFQSRIEGNVLFSIDKGEVLWSQLDTQERLSLEEGGTDISSCMVSILTEPKEWSVSITEKQRKCEPKPQS